MMRDTVLPTLIALAVRVLAATWRVRRRDVALLDEALAEGPLVLALLHEDLLPLGVLHRGRGLLPMTSLSPDGELLSRSLERLGFRTVRGSTRHGAVRGSRAALRALLAGEGSPVVAVDGPRGPRGIVHRGVAALAAAGRRPVVYAVARAAPAVRFRSWDRFQVPLPFARVEIHYGRLDPPEPGREPERRAADELGARMRALAGLPDSA